MAVRLGSNKWGYNESNLQSNDLNDTFRYIHSEANTSLFSVNNNLPIGLIKNKQVSSNDFTAISGKVLSGIGAAYRVIDECNGTGDLNTTYWSKTYPQDGDYGDYYRGDGTANISQGTLLNDGESATYTTWWGNEGYYPDKAIFFNAQVFVGNNGDGKINLTDGTNTIELYTLPAGGYFMDFLLYISGSNAKLIVNGENKGIFDISSLDTTQLRLEFWRYFKRDTSGSTTNYARLYIEYIGNDFLGNLELESEEVYIEQPIFYEFIGYKYGNPDISYYYSTDGGTTWNNIEKAGYIDYVGNIKFKVISTNNDANNFYLFDSLILVHE